MKIDCMPLSFIRTWFIEGYVECDVVTLSYNFITVEIDDVLDLVKACCFALKLNCSLTVKRLLFDSFKPFNLIMAM
jgi:hypothetical protein